VSERTAGAGLDAGLDAGAAALAVQRAIRAATTAGAGVPAWAETVAGLLDAWSQQLEGGRSAGLAGTARASGVWWRAPGGVLEGVEVPAAPLSAHPLLVWLRLRFGLRRCLACGRLGGYGSLQPASPLVPPAWARTWRCRDQLGCCQRRIQREGRR